MISPDGETEFLKVSNGVLLGDTTAPHPFIIIVNYSMRITGKNEQNLEMTLNRTTARNQFKHKNYLIHTQHSDDLIIPSNTTADAYIFSVKTNCDKTDVVMYHENGTLTSITDRKASSLLTASTSDSGCHEHRKISNAEQFCYVIRKLEEIWT